MTSLTSKDFSATNDQRHDHYISLVKQVMTEAHKCPPDTIERARMIIESVRLGCMVCHHNILSTTSADPNSVKLKVSIRDRAIMTLSHKLLSTSTFQKEKMILEGILDWIAVNDWYKAGMYFGSTRFSGEIPIYHLPGFCTIERTADRPDPTPVKRTNALVLFRDEIKQKNQSKVYPEKKIKIEWRKLKRNNPEQVKHYQKLAKAVNTAC